MHGPSHGWEASSACWSRERVSVSYLGFFCMEALSVLTHSLSLLLCQNGLPRPTSYLGCNSNTYSSFRFS